MAAIDLFQRIGNLADSRLGARGLDGAFEQIAASCLGVTGHRVKGPLDRRLVALGLDSPIDDFDSVATERAAGVIALASLRSEPRITDAFRTGAGVGWHEHHDDLFTGCELFFRPGYLANLTTSWIPALDGVEEKLAAGATVADIGCGLGSSSLLMAQAYPRASIVGSDYHDVSIEQARKDLGYTDIEQGRMRDWDANVTTDPQIDAAGRALDDAAALAARAGDGQAVNDAQLGS